MIFVTMAKNINGTPAVFTFHPHPLAVLKPESCPQLLSQEYKQEIFAVRRSALTIPFNLKLAASLRKILFVRYYVKKSVRVVLW